MIEKKSICLLLILASACISCAHYKEVSTYEKMSVRRSAEEAKERASAAQAEYFAIQQKNEELMRIIAQLRQQADAAEIQSGECERKARAAGFRP